MIIRKKHFADLYEDVLDKIIHTGQLVAPRGLNIHELTNVTLVLDNPLSCLYTNKRRSSQMKYIYAEYLWYLMGDNNVEFISKYSKFWLNISNLDNTVNSAYGYLIFKDKYNGNALNQWEWAMISLFNDKYSRQAILHFNKPYHQYADNKDFVCTMYGIFTIRDNKLNFTIHMRSNDAIIGLPTDIAFFCLLQANALNVLKQVYPELTMGTYTHIVNSLHIYDRHFDLVNEMLGHEFHTQDLPNGCELLISGTGRTTNYIHHVYNHIMYNKQYDTIPTHDIEKEIEKYLINNKNK